VRQDQGEQDVRFLLLTCLGICAAAFGAAADDSIGDEGDAQAPRVFEEVYADARVVVLRIAEEPESADALREAVHAEITDAIGDPVVGEGYDPYQAVADAFLTWPWEGAVRGELLYQQRRDDGATPMAMGDLALPLFLLNLTEEELPGRTDFMFVVAYAEGMMQTLISRALIPAGAAEAAFTERGAYLVIPRTGLNTSVVIPYEPIAIRGFFRETAIGDALLIMAEGEVEMPLGCAPAAQAPGRTTTSALAVASLTVFIAGLALRHRRNRAHQAR